MEFFKEENYQYSDTFEDLSTEDKTFKTMPSMNNEPTFMTNDDHIKTNNFKNAKGSSILNKLSPVLTPVTSLVSPMMPQKNKVNQ